jgi:hypothetical protein
MTAMKSVEEYSDEELETLVEGKTRPVMIRHDGDKVAFYRATEDERKAWNGYAIQAAAEFDANPSLDSYDSHHVFPGRTRDGICADWTPPLWFPEWLAERNGGEPMIVHLRSRQP